jgi:superfamily II DNA or RNA helicase
LYQIFQASDTHCASITGPPVLRSLNFSASLLKPLSDLQLLISARTYTGNPDFYFRRLQLTLIQHILSREADMVVILPTGYGKSLLFFLPAFIENQDRRKYITVVIAPLRALSQQIQKLCRYSKTPHVLYTSGMPADDACAVTILAVEQIDSTALAFLQQLSGQGRLARLIFDECHLVVSWLSFRFSLQNLRKVAGLPVPLVLLTATLPPCKENALKDFIGIPGAKTFRPDSTWRPNIKFMMDIAPSEDALKSIMLQHLRQSPDTQMQADVVSNRAIVFCLTKDECRTTSIFLNSNGISNSTYWSHDVDEKIEDDDQTSSAMTNLNNWIEGKTQVIVSTTGISCAVDSPNVRTVICVGMPYDLLTFAQMAGRGGRDGKRSVCVVLSSQAYEDKMTHILRETTRLEFPKGECRRKFLHDHLDGNSTTCLGGEKGTQLCDVCEENVLRPPIPPANKWITPTAVSPSEGESFHIVVMINRYWIHFCFTLWCFVVVIRRSDAASSFKIQKDLSLQRAVACAKATGSQCILCSMFGGTKAAHPFTMCLKIRGFCFKCLDSSHKSSICPNKLVFSVNGTTCFKCLFPRDTIGHGAMSECANVYLDKIAPSCWYWYRFKRQTNSMQALDSLVDGSHTASATTFQKWLQTEDAKTGLLNALQLFAKLSTIYPVE